MMAPVQHLLFLDFDGVLNSRAWLLTGQATDVPGGVMRHLDPAAVMRLDRLVRETSARVVISSTWRILHCLTDLRSMLRAKGFTGTVIGTTPENGKCRGFEIQAWLDRHPGHGPFVILDDDSDMAHLMPRLVKTHFDIGLQDEHVERAIAMLKGTDQ